jgi:DNA (cytosine-5)-methyltransferase 1
VPKTRPLVSAVDLFCGVGGLTHGLARGGVEVRAGFDLDPACRFPYEANNKARFIEQDVGGLSARVVAAHLEGGDYTLLAGCAPCQSFSTYSRAGRSKKRELDWTLVARFGELITQVKPDLVTMENVPQLAAHDVFQQFLRCLVGYDVQWSIVECSTLGIPQSRRRLVLLASRLNSEVSFDTANLKESDPVTVREVIGDLPPIRAGSQLENDPLHAAPSLSDLNLRRIRASRPGGSWRDWDQSIRSPCHKKDTGATYPSVYGRMQWDAVAPTITTQCFGYGNGRFGHPEQDRAISLREAAMLQTFPERYAFVDKDQAVRFNSLGRLIGNAVPVRLGEAIAEALFAHLAGMRSSGS